jgi:hypothetical protein
LGLWLPSEIRSNLWSYEQTEAAEKEVRFPYFYPFILYFILFYGIETLFFKETTTLSYLAIPRKQTVFSQAMNVPENYLIYMQNFTSQTNKQ